MMMVMLKLGSAPPLYFVRSGVSGDDARFRTWLWLLPLLQIHTDILVIYYQALNGAID